MNLTLSQQVVNKTHPLNRGLVSWWLNLPGRRWGGGPTWRDLMGRNDGTLSGGMDTSDWIGAKGRPGGFGGLGFDGAANFVSMPGAVVTATPLTISCWFRALDADTTYTLVSIGDSGHASRLTTLLLRGAEAGDPVSADTRSGGTFASAKTTTGYTAGQWYFATGVFASTSDRKVYIDGGSEGINTDIRATLNYNSTEIGRLSDSSPGAWFSGEIDDVRIYNRALSAAEVHALYTESKQGYPRGLNWQSTTAFAPVAAASTGNPWNYYQQMAS